MQSLTRKTHNGQGNTAWKATKLSLGLYIIQALHINSIIVISLNQDINQRMNIQKSFLSALSVFGCIYYLWKRHVVIAILEVRAYGVSVPYMHAYLRLYMVSTLDNSK